MAYVPCAFGNEISWILDALEYIKHKYEQWPLDVKFNIYGDDPKNVPGGWQEREYKQLLALGGQEALLGIGFRWNTAADGDLTYDIDFRYDIVRCRCGCTDEVKGAEGTRWVQCDNQLCGAWEVSPARQSGVGDARADARLPDRSTCRAPRRGKTRSTSSATRARSAGSWRRIGSPGRPGKPGRRSAGSAGRRRRCR